MTMAIPEVKKKYTIKSVLIDRTLGTGSFGRVHLVKLKEEKIYSALKVLRKADVLRMKQLEHTCSERTILSELKHPFLVSLIGTFQDTENVYFLLEYIQGGELFSCLRKYVVIFHSYFRDFLTMWLDSLHPRFFWLWNTCIQKMFCIET